MAQALGFHFDQLQPFPGASGQTWSAGKHVLRVRPSSAVDLELAAMSAAADALPVPRVLDRVDRTDVSAVLLERISGRPAGNVDELTPAAARRIGHVCAELHRTLSAIEAPTMLPHAAGCVGFGSPDSGRRLLHLDLHPWNILLKANEVVAVIDWANAASGHPVLDKARTASILTLDPAACARRIDERWRALTDGWLEEIEGDIDYNARAWACRYLLTDLANRYRTCELEPVSQRLKELEGHA